MKSKVFVQFPKVGLGNMLLIWARAFVFASDNNLQLATSGWWAIRWGSWLRNDNKKRLYWKYFQEESLMIKLMFIFYKFFYKTVEVLEIFPSPVLDDKIYLFNKLITKGDYFKDLKLYRDKIRDQINLMLHPRLQIKLKNLQIPVIGVHIRRGDFIHGSTITPLSYFIDVIEGIRREANANLPVTVFSDAKDEEIRDILDLTNVSRSIQHEDIIDLLVFSQSKFLVLSVSSTFSFWAAFLSDGIIIKMPNEWHPDIRPEFINQSSFEGKWDPIMEMPTLLKQKISKFREKSFEVEKFQKLQFDQSLKNI